MNKNIMRKPASKHEGGLVKVHYAGQVRVSRLRTPLQTVTVTIAVYRVQWFFPFQTGVLLTVTVTVTMSQVKWFFPFQTEVSVTVTVTVLRLASSMAFPISYRAVGNVSDNSEFNGFFPSQKCQTTKKVFN